MITFINLFSFSQVNLVPNPGFEDYNCCPTGPNPNDDKRTGSLIIPCLNYWKMPDRKPYCKIGSADYWNTCGWENCYGGKLNTPRTGNGNAGLVTWERTFLDDDYREYITVELTTMLTLGKSYHVEFYVKQCGMDSGQIGTIGAYFSYSRPKACKYYIDGNPAPQIENLSLVSYNNNWVKVSGTLFVNGLMNYITIGNFRNDALTFRYNDPLLGQTYYLIDDVSVFETCTEELLIENTIYTQHEDPYEAEVIRAGYDVGAPTANGAVIVKNGADITYKAEREIQCDVGVEPGGIFSAFLAPCGRNCFFPAASAGGDLSLCGSQLGQQLGMPPEDDCYYLWSASPASAIAYLNNPAISNPVFNIPPTGWGTIIYTLTVTNNCADLVMDHVKVNYDAQPDPNPFVIVSNLNPGAYISFNLAVNPHTEQVKIEVYNWAMTSLLHSYTLNTGVDFNCCAFSWTIPDYLTNCYDYKIKVSSKNFCVPAFSTPVIVDWVNERNITVGPLTNAFTPDGDGLNEELCIIVTGAESYSVIVRTRSGSIVYTGSGTIGGNMACVWNGYCNTGLCSGELAPIGTYFYIIDFSNCINNASAAGFVQLLGDFKTSWNDSVDNGSENTDINTSAAGSKLSGLSNEMDTRNENTLISIFPNPNEGTFTLSTGSESDLFPATVFVYDVLGNIIYRATDVKSPLLNIDISGHAKGIYFVRVQKGNEQFLKKVAKQ